MGKLDRLVWAASSTYLIGLYHLGVRTDSEWLDGVIRAALSVYHVSDVEAPANFSVVVPRTDAKAAVKGLNMLYEDHTNLVRSRSPERVLQALFRHLGQHLPGDSNGHIRVSQLALVREGRSILVPRGVTTWMGQLAPRLNRAGWQFVDQPWSTIDLGKAELVVPQLILDIDDAWKDQITMPQKVREPDVVEPGRYPLTGWGVFSADQRVMSPAAGVAAAAASVLNAAQFGVQETLQELLRLVARVSITGLGSPIEGDFPARIAALDQG